MLDVYKLKKDKVRTNSYVWSYVIATAAGTIFKLIPPVKTYLTSNDINTNYVSHYERYVSVHHLVPINKYNHHCKSKIIAWNQPVKCFNTEKECIQDYNKTLLQKIYLMKTYKTQQILDIDKNIIKLNDALINN